MKKLELEFTGDQQDPRWWSKTTAKMAAINNFVKEHGKGFHRVETTIQGEIFNVHLVEARDGALTLRTYSMVDILPLQRIKSITKDDQAEKEYKKLQTEDDRDSFLKKWHGQGSKWKVRGAIGVLS